MKDTGIGIPEDKLAALFESFTRGSNVGNISGTGLGLSIVKRAVDLHRGRIVCESQIGAGTQFIVYLPKATDEASLNSIASMLKTSVQETSIHKKSNLKKDLKQSDSKELALKELTAQKGGNNILDPQKMEWLNETLW